MQNLHRLRSITSKYEQKILQQKIFARFTEYFSFSYYLHTDILNSFTKF